MIQSGVLLLLTAAALGGQDLKVTFDAKSLLVGGERLIWLSGGTHYARHEPEMWLPLLRQASLIDHTSPRRRRRPSLGSPRLIRRSMWLCVVGVGVAVRGVCACVPRHR